MYLKKKKSSCSKSVRCGFKPQLWSDLLLDERHDADSGEDRLPTQALPRHAVCERLRPIGHRLAQVPHKERHVRSGKEEGEEKCCMRLTGGWKRLSSFNQRSSPLLEFFLSLAPEVSDQPLRGESVLRGHPPAHHCVQESLSLPRVEPQHLLMEITTHFRCS